VLFERHQRLPMLDLSLFRIGAFAGANLVAMLVSLAMFGVFFFVSLYIQNILGYSATQAGAMFLPMTILIILIAPIAGRFSDRVGSRWLMGGGMALVGVSLLLYQRVGLHSNFWTLLPAMVLGGIGMASTMSPMTAAAMGAVPVDKAGVGSGVLNSFRQVGGSLGIALIGAIVASYIHHPPRSLAGAQDYLNGLHAGLAVSAAISFVAAIVAVVTVRTRPEVVREHIAELAA
jgi:MFS family permease